MPQAQKKTLVKPPMFLCLRSPFSRSQGEDGSLWEAENSRSVFAVAAAEAVGLPGVRPHLFHGCPCSVDSGWEGEKRGRRQWERRGRRGD